MIHGITFAMRQRYGSKSVFPSISTLFTSSGSIFSSFTELEKCTTLHECQSIKLCGDLDYTMGGAKPQYAASEFVQIVGRRGANKSFTDLIPSYPPFGRVFYFQRGLGRDIIT